MDHRMDPIFVNFRISLRKKFLAQNRHVESYFDQTAPEDDQQFGGVRHCS